MVSFAFLAPLPRSLIPSNFTPLKPTANSLHLACRRPRPTVVATLAYDPQILESFCAQIKGEWTGYEGNFDATTGLSQPVPDFYIPEEFSAWGLTPRGFETNHSITVRSDKLYRKFFRVLPNVSLFGDHVDTEEDFKIDLIGDNLTIYPDGAFACGAKKLPIKKSKLVKPPLVEFRLPHPYEEKQAANVSLRLDFESAAIADDIRVVIEKWTCIYCDGADMEGSSGYVEGWVIGNPGSAEQLIGRWRRGEDTFEREHAMQHQGGDVFLPEGIDIAFEQSSDGGRIVRAAWRVRDRRLVMQRAFDDEGSLVDTQRFIEERP